MKSVLLSILTMFVVAGIQGQTAEEIVAKHIEASGGKEKWSGIKSMVLESSTEVMGNEMASKTTVANGKSFRSESDFNGQQIVQVVNEKSGWSINPFSGTGSPEAMPAEMYNSISEQIFLPDPLLDYQARGSKVTLEGKEKVGEVDAYKLKYTNSGNSETTFFIDPATHYVVRTLKKADVMGQEVTVTSDYSDYKKTEEGVVIPYTTNIDMGQFALTVKVNKVDFNTEIDPSLFEMPK